MKTIKIFLASSEELAEERMRFGDFIRQLDDTYEQRGFRVKLIKWEDLPSGDEGKPKQDEYNEKVKECDMFVTLFHTKAGKYTLEEYNVAKASQETEGRPTVYVFCRELKDNEQEEPSLTDFKERLLKTIRHYWNSYSNSDSLQLQFVMQLLKVENNHWNDLKVENGIVQLGDKPIAQMDNLRFAIDNEDYQRIQHRLTIVREEIDNIRKQIELHPDNEDFRNDLQNLLYERASLQDDFQQQQHFLFDTAKRIAQLQEEFVTDRMKKAMEAFEKGNANKANIILNEAESDAKRNFTDYKQSKELSDQKKESVIRSIEELILKTSTMMADNTIPIEERVVKTINLYSQADEMAQVVNYDKERYSHLLFDFAQFLYKQGHFRDASAIFFRQIAIAEVIYGEEDPNTATSYNNIGYCYNNQGDFQKALEYYYKALEIRENVFGSDHPIVAESYNNIGSCYHQLGDYPKALDFHFKALKIWEHLFGEIHPNIATSYNNIGGIYSQIGDHEEALKFFSKALDIRKKLFGQDSPDVATSYNNVGTEYYEQGDYDKALEFVFKALDIRIKILGNNHPDTATTYNNIAALYAKQQDYSKALEYFTTAMEIQEKVLGKDHYSTANTYNNIGTMYLEQSNFIKALEYYHKALEIREKVFGEEHLETASSYNGIGSVYDRQENYPKALEYFSKTLKIREKILGEGHLSTAILHLGIGVQYSCMNKNQEALDHLNKSLNIYRKHNDISGIRAAEEWIKITNRQIGYVVVKKDQSFFGRLFGKTKKNN